MSYLMGVDIGSTSIKVIIYDHSGNCVSSASRPTPLSYPDLSHPTWSVWEPDKIWDAIVASIRDAIGSMKQSGEIEGIAVTGIGMDGLPMDKDGNELYPMISWHCPRTIPQYERFTEQVTKEKIFKLTGLQPSAMNAIYRMLWMNDNHPEILDKTYKWLLIEDYINYRLCGEMATDYSMGTCFSLFDHATREWSAELANAAGISAEILPRVNQSGTVLGNILPDAAKQTGLPESVKVVLGGHDYICSMLAIGAVDNSVLLDITGTWEMLVQTSSTFDTSKAVYDSGYWVEGHVVKDKYCFVASAVSGDMTEWAKDQLAGTEAVVAGITGDKTWDLIEKRLSESALGANGCFFLPHFTGAGAPRIDPNSMGAFLGLHNAVTKADMMRAVFEGLDYQFRVMLDAFKEAKIGNMQRIFAAGGACKNRFWMQNKADVTGISLEVPDVYESTTLGAAMLAGIGCGVYKDEFEAVAAVRRPAVVYEPDMELHKKYDELYREVYCKLQDTLADVNASISRRFR